RAQRRVLSPKSSPRAARVDRASPRARCPVAMVVGCLELTLSIESAQTLKEKRSVVRRCSERMKNKFNVAVAEVGANDEARRAVIGITTVANDGAFVNSVLDKALNQLEDDALGHASVIDTRLELVHF